MPLATAAIVAVALVVTLMMAGGGGVGRAQGNGDLLLDWETSDNTATSVGVVDTGCQSFSAGSVVRIDVIADNAVDWAAIDFVIEYPSPAVVQRPGPGDGQEGGAYDFVPSNPGDPADTFGAQNFIFPDSSDTNADYSTTDDVPDGSSPHGVSMFDNSLAGNSGSGGMARISLETAGLAPGVYALSLRVTPAFAGAVHSDASGLQVDNLGSVLLAIDTDCPSGPLTLTPTPGAPTAPATSEALPPSGGSGGGGGNGWLIVLLYVVGGVIAATAAVGAIYLRLRRRAARK